MANDFYFNKKSFQEKIWHSLILFITNSYVQAYLFSCTNINIDISVSR